MRLAVQLPSAQAVYDDVQFIVNGQSAVPVTEKGRIYVDVYVPAGQTVKLRAGYRSQGLGSWRYKFGEDINTVGNFHLQMTTNFKDIDFPDNTLAPVEKREIPAGWQLDWTYKNLLSGYEIALAMPEKVQPGPLVSEISFFAPVSLLFFFFLMYIITTMRGTELHPMNYFFLACAFFAFHLLLAYLADHVDIFVSFGIAAAVSVFLVVSYLRIVAGPRFALREAALIQFVYLVLFSGAFFFRGFTGLTITLGSILTLFLVMQLTARVSWSEKFDPAPPRFPTPNSLS
jgi:inner membrane protein involved in colicin E2 resistance